MAVAVVGGIGTGGAFNGSNISGVSSRRAHPSRERRGRPAKGSGVDRLEVLQRGGDVVPAGDLAQRYVFQHVQLEDLGVLAGDARQLVEFPAQPLVGIGDAADDVPAGRGLDDP